MLRMTNRGAHLPSLPVKNTQPGHYDADFTLRTYTHATRQQQNRAAETMGNFMSQVM